MSILINTFRESKELKRLIVERSISNNIPIKYLCNEARVDYKNFMAQYINATATSSVEILEWQIEKMLGVLGINIRFQFVINSSLDMADVSRKLADKYDLKSMKG